MRQVNARHALIVGRKRDWYPEHPVKREGMIFAIHAEDRVIACQTDFHHHVIRGHLFQKGVGTILVNDVDTVTDALRLRLLDGQANVATEALVRNQARRKLARMQAHVDLRVQRVKEADHAHVQRVVGHRRVTVLGHD